MHWMKLSLCLALSVWIFLFLRVIKKCRQARTWLVNGIIGGLTLRIAGAVLLYSFWPHLNYSSDPVRAYIVQAREVLAGMVPYRDFASSYSLLFGPILAVPVFLWNSVGAIALFMSAVEIAGMWFYLQRDLNGPNDRDLMVAFAWAWFPSHFYWLSLAGYNSGMIAAGVMASVTLAHKKKDLAAGLVSAVTFLTTKLLALLFWPAVAFQDFDRTRVIQRLVPHVGAVLFLAIMATTGADPLVPVKLEFGKSTSGTMWFYWWLLGKEWRASVVYSYGPVVLFFIIFLLLLKRYRDYVAMESPSFDASAAFIACTGLLFMLLSRKAYSFYLPMFLPFLFHVVLSRQIEWRAFLSLLVLGTVTTIEPYLWVQVRSAASSWSDPRIWLLAMIDTAVVVSYLVLAKLCWKRLGRA